MRAREGARRENAQAPLAARAKGRRVEKPSPGSFSPIRLLPGLPCENVALASCVSDAEHGPDEPYAPQSPHRVSQASGSTWAGMEGRVGKRGNACRGGRLPQLSA
jgi:hypothetical protein